MTAQIIQFPKHRTMQVQIRNSLSQAAKECGSEPSEEALNEMALRIAERIAQRIAESRKP